MKIYLTLSDLTTETAIQKIDLELRARNTNVLDLIIVDEDNLVVNLTSCIVFFTVKSKLSDTDVNAVLKKDVSSHYDALNGETKVTLTSTDTDNIAGNYIYSIKLKKSDNTIYTLCEGFVTFKQELSTRTS